MLPFTQQELLSASRVITLGDITTGFAGGEEGPLKVGPMNARINFTEFSAPPSGEVKARFMAAGEEALPETWSWRADQIDSTYDTGTRLERKKLITPILNQGVCGSCWAVSTASSISDVFTVAGYVQEESQTLKGQPESIISPTSILSCFRDSKYCDGCNGGLPIVALGGDGAGFPGINEKGVYSSNCNSYEWCYSNGYCAGQESFSGDENDLMNQLNGAMPGCGCVNPDKKLKFTVKNVIAIPGTTHDSQGNVVAVKGNSPAELENTWNIVRSHIWNIGPVVGGYIVFANFMGGDFSETDGVYFEDGNYNGKGKQQVGAHAVRIVGWGVQKNCRTPSGKRQDVPYWVVANSWGPKWGDNGFFKMARYPFNKTSQFDAALPDANSAFLGGMVLFEAGQVIPGDWSKTSGFSGSNPSFYNSEVAIQNESPVSSGGGSGPSPSPSPSSNVPFYQQPYFILILLLLFIGLVIWGIVYFSKRRTVSDTGEYTGYASMMSLSDFASTPTVPLPAPRPTPAQAVFPAPQPTAYSKPSQNNVLTKALAMRNWNMRNWSMKKF